MELSEETFHEIHQYLSGQGTIEERAAFERRVRTDDALAAEVNWQRRIRNGLKANEYKKIFKDIHAQLQNEGALPGNVSEVKTIPLVPESRGGVRWPFLAAAASVLIAVGLVWYFNQKPGNGPVASDNPKVPATQDTTAPVQPVERPDTATNNAPEPELAKPAPATVNPVEYFASYFDANAALESPFSKDKLSVSPSALAQWRSDTAQVQQGIRYLVQRQTAQALQAFSQVETSRFQQLKRTVAWYQALAYLQQNDIKKCREQLKKVASDPENSYHKRAAELLSKI